jgi:prophage antirepressor-like protein
MSLFNATSVLSLSECFNGSEVFSVSFDNEPEKTRHWFRMKEVCKVLEFRNTKETAEIHLKDWQYKEIKLGKGRPALYVCLSGLFRLCLRSKSPMALEFQDWLTEVILPKIIASGGYISPSATSKQLTSLREEITHLQSQLETEQAKTLYMANFIDDGLQQAKTQAKIDWQCESSDVKGDPVVFAKAMIQERDEIAAKLRQYKDFGKAMHFFLSEAHPKILEEAATVWDVPKLPE